MSGAPDEDIEMKTPAVPKFLSGSALVASALALAAACVPGVTLADTYPSKPIKIIVPFAPGSATDTAARVIGAALAPSLKVPVTIENKAGAGGTIGAASVATAAPDGYTLVMTSSSTHSAATAIVAKVPYDGAEDFVHIARVASIPMMLVTRPELNIHSVDALREASAKKPMAYAYGSATSQIAAGTFTSLSGVKALAVPYKSQPPAVTDLLGGQVDFLFGDVSVVKAFVDAKRLTPLALSAPKRSKDFPDVPTLAELGYKNFDLIVWVGLAAPKGTPEPIVERLAKATMDALRGPESAAKLAGVGMEVAPLAGPELQTFVRAQKQTWVARAQAAGVKPE